MIKYPHTIQPMQPVIILPDLTSISKTNELITAILLNEDTTPFLYLVNEIIDGWSPLMIAVGNCNQWSTIHTVEILIESGADLNAQNLMGNTALMVAVEYSRKDAVEMLIKAGAKLDLQNRVLDTALMRASIYCNKNSTEEIAQMLINAGAKVDILDGNGMTALLWCVIESNRYSSINMVLMLIRAGANIDFASRTKIIALMYASTYTDISHTDAIKILVRAGANVGLQDYYGNTALISSICNHKNCGYKIPILLTEMQKKLEHAEICPIII